MDSKIEIARVVSLLRNLSRGGLGDCKRAIDGGDLDRAGKEITDVGDKLKRAIALLNQLR
jgi:hypothetical protein